MAQMTAFALLGLPVTYDLTAQSIEQNWLKAIALVHPDRFADRSAAEKRVAQQWAGQINEAKKTLLDPVERAVYLLKLHGIDVNSQTDTKMDAAFLLEQMQWREQAQETGGADRVLPQIEQARDRQCSVLSRCFAEPLDLLAAREAVRRLMFIEKIRRDLTRDIN